MIIKRSLNNNVVITENKDGIEQVVCGRGIAFKKKPGDEIDESLINQIFVLKNEQYNHRFQEIVTSIPLEYLDLADDIISLIRSYLGKKMSDSIYITLSDHVFTAIERAKEGIHMPNTMLWEIRNYYDSEYEIALKVLDMIEEKTGVRLKDDEAGFIALHIVNAETDESSLEKTMAQTKIIQEIARIVRYYFGKEFDTESVHYYRFITHLKFFSQRLVRGTTYEGSEDDELLNVVKKKYREAFECTERVAEMIQRNYKYRLSDEEKLYLTIHIHRIVNQNDNH
ncbi:MAG: PRD domain-containing protein [Erysipelotrichaceae bacterium]|nr:PRD domain-containing protein [Erysipelotrichaceae bacterium]